MRHGFVQRSACPACGATAARPLFACAYGEDPLRGYIAGYYGAQRLTELDGQVYALDQCTACTLVFQRHIGDDGFLFTLYDQWLNSADNEARAMAQNQPLLKSPRTSRDGHELMWVASHLRQPLAGLKTLDYGMGWALWARIAKMLGCQSYGFDLSRQRMKLAQLAGVQVLQEADFPEGGFDFINTEQVFEHVPEPLALAVRLARALRPGGILKVSVPNGADIERLLAVGDWRDDNNSPHSLVAVAPLEHINCFNPQAVARMGQLAGLAAVAGRVWPQYAFLGHPGSIGLHAPKEAVKELLRPWYRFGNRKSLYVWLQKPA